MIVEVVRGVAPAAIHEAVERVVGLRPSRVATRGGGSGGAVAVRVGGGGRVALGDEKSSYEYDRLHKSTNGVPSQMKSVMELESKSGDMSSSLTAFLLEEKPLGDMG